MNQVARLWNYFKKRDNFIVLLLSLSCLTLLPLVDVARGAMVVSFILLLFGKEKLKTIKSYLSTPYKWMFWSCLSLYFLYVIGIFYSPDKLSGINELENKITLLLIPIMFVLIPKRLFAEKFQKKYLFSYIGGCLAFALGTLINAFVRFAGNPELSSTIFFKSELALYVHTTYASLFFVMGIVFAFYLLKQRIALLKWQKYFLISMIILFCGYTVLLSSRGGIFALVIAIFFIVLSFFNTFKGRIYGFLFFLLFIGILIFLGNKVDYLHHRINATKNAIENYQNASPKQDPRISLWQRTIPVIKERFWFGIGTGGKDIAMQPIRLDDHPELNNPHNQYLQTWIEIGFIGVLGLCFMFLTGLWLGIKRREYILTIFILIFSFNCFFESLLERVQGNTFFVFILFLIMNIIFKGKEIKKQDSVY